MDPAGSARTWRASGVARLALAGVAMLLVAELAALLLAPTDTITPLPVSASEWFDAAASERAAEFRGGQRLLFLAGVACQLAAVAALALGRPRRLAGLLRRFGRRPLLGAAAAGGLTVVWARVASLPASFVAHERAVDFGISVRGDLAWLGDVALATAINALVIALAALVLVALVRRFPRRWWLPGSLAVVAIAVLITVVAPVLFAPRFNEFVPLPERSQLRQQVLGLADRAGVDVGEVYRVDASRRSTTLNAYVGGLGPSKRVVLYDNLIEEAERRELLSVVAHELGHVAHRDIMRGLAFVALVAPLGLLFARELSSLIARRRGLDPGAPAAVPALLLGVVLAALLLQLPGNQLSRRVEASADAFALRLTEDPRGLIGLQLRTADSNLSEPEPPTWAEWLFSTHPSKLERIGAALAYERER
jgi:STE24 endopeptidase